MQCSTGDKCIPCVIVRCFADKCSLGGLGSSYKMILTEAVCYCMERKWIVDGIGSFFGSAGKTGRITSAFC